MVVKYLGLFILITFSTTNICHAVEMGDDTWNYMFDGIDFDLDSLPGPEVFDTLFVNPTTSESSCVKTDTTSQDYEISDEFVDEAPGATKRGRWQEREHDLLTKALQEKPNDFAYAAKIVKTKSKKQCSARWRNHNPNICKKPFTSEECAIIKKKREQQMGWAAIAHIINQSRKPKKQKTPNQVKNWWNSRYYLKKDE